MAVRIVAFDPIPEPEDFLNPSLLRSFFSIAARSSEGFRLGLRRQLSVVSSVPCPFVSIDPPSRMK
jgi:hypothetical protein